MVYVTIPPTCGKNDSEPKTIFRTYIATRFKPYDITHIKAYAPTDVLISVLTENVQSLFTQ